METTIIIANHSKNLFDLVDKLIGQGYKPNEIDYELQFESEGQVTFDLVFATYDSILHLGKSAYYFDIIVPWRDYIESTEIQKIISEELILMMDTTLGIVRKFAVIGEDRFSLVYDCICDGDNLNNILELNFVKENINYLELLGGDLDMFNVTKVTDS